MAKPRTPPVRRREGRALQRARMEVLAAHSRSVAHGLGNLLAGLGLTLELLADTPLNDQQHRYVARCLSLAERLGREKALLAALGGGGMQSFAWLATGPLLQAALAPFAADATGHGTCTVAAGAERVWGDEALLHEALAQLLGNANDALAGDGRLGIAAAPAQKAGRGSVVLSVWDEGMGVAAELLPHLGRRPVAAKPHGQGMGLMRAAAIIEQVHGGTLVLKNRPNCGTVAHVTLPSAP